MVTLKRLRKENRYSQQELAKLAGISRQYLSMIELGDCNPTIEVMQSLAKVLRCTVDELIKQNDAQ